jgi:hypothetical protein
MVKWGNPRESDDVTIEDCQTPASTVNLSRKLNRDTAKNVGKVTQYRLKTLDIVRHHLSRRETAVISAYVKIAGVAPVSGVKPQCYALPKASRQVNILNRVRISIIERHF